MCLHGGYRVRHYICTVCTYCVVIFPHSAQCEHNFAGSLVVLGTGYVLLAIDIRGKLDLIFCHYSLYTMYSLIHRKSDASVKIGMSAAFIYLSKKCV